MTLLLTTTNVAADAINVSPNINPKFVFSDNLDADTITDSTCYLTNTLDDELVKVELKVTDKTLWFYPKQVLREETRYQLTLVGKVHAGTEWLNYINKDSTNYFPNSYSFYFTTGVLADSVIVDIPDEFINTPGFIDSELLSELDGSELNISLVSPDPLSFGFPRTLSEIIIKFSEEVTPDDSLVNVTVRPIFGNNSILAVDHPSGAANCYLFNYQDQLSTLTSWVQPEASFTWSGEYLTIDFDKEFFYNDSIFVELDSTIAAASNSNKTLKVDTAYEFILECLPTYSSIFGIALHPVGMLLEKTLSQPFMYKYGAYASYSLYRQYGNRSGIDIDTYSYFAEEYVNIMLLQYLLGKELLSGNMHGFTQKVTLGDWSKSRMPSLSKFGIDGTSMARIFAERLRAIKIAITGGAIKSNRIRRSQSFYLTMPRLPTYDDYDANTYYTNKGKYLYSEYLGYVDYGY